MARQTGGQMGFALPASSATPTVPTAILAVTRWNCRDESVDTETTAAGDLTEDFEHLRTRIRVVGEARLEIPSGANPYDVRSTLIGVKVAFAGKVNLAHTNGIVSGTLKVNAIEIDSPLSDPVAVTYELGSAGVPLVYDLTPAS